MELDARHAGQDLGRDHAYPQPGERARAEADDDLPEVGQAYASLAEAVPDRRHQLLDVGHPVRDGGLGEHLVAAGQPDVHHGRGVQGQDEAAQP